MVYKNLFSQARLIRFLCVGLQLNNVKENAFHVNVSRNAFFNSHPEKKNNFSDVDIVVKTN